MGADQITFLFLVGLPLGNVQMYQKKRRTLAAKAEEQIPENRYLL